MACRDGARRRSGARAQARVFGDAKRQAEFPWTVAAHTPIETRRLGDDDEPFLGGPDRLGIADQQKAAFLQGEMEQGDDSGLGLGQEIDQQVPA